MDPRPHQPQSGRQTASSGGVIVTSDLRALLDTGEVDGCRVRFPQPLARTTYERLDRVLVAAGGRWNRRDNAHVFGGVASVIISRLVATGKVELPASRGPFVAVAAVAVDDQGRVVLGRRGKDPGYGAWLLPGGRVEEGEPLTAALEREFLEETGLGIRVAGRPGDAGVREWSEGDALWVVLYTHAEVVGTTGHARPGGDVAEVTLVDRASLQRMASTGQLWYGGSWDVLAENGWGGQR